MQANTRNRLERAFQAIQRAWRVYRDWRRRRIARRKALSYLRRYDVKFFNDPFDR